MNPNYQSRRVVTTTSMMTTEPTSNHSVTKQSFLEIQQEALLLQQQQQQQQQPPTRNRTDRSNQTTKERTGQQQQQQQQSRKSRHNENNHINNNNSNSNNNRNNPSNNTPNESSVTTSTNTSTDVVDGGGGYYYGTICSLKKDFGFISYTMDTNNIDIDDDTVQIFFHASALRSDRPHRRNQQQQHYNHDEPSEDCYTGKSFETLQINDEVEFRIKTSVIPNDTSNNNNNNSTTISSSSSATKTMAVQVRTLCEGTRAMKREAIQLQKAVVEYGHVWQLRSEYGTILSTARRPRHENQIHFTYDHIVFQPNEEGGGGEDAPPTDQLVLKEGQDVQFRVIYQTDDCDTSTQRRHGGRHGRRRRMVVARQIYLLPMGTVVAHTVVARGQTGCVTTLPRDASSDGIVWLLPTPIRRDYHNEDDEEEETNAIIKEVRLALDDAPGGIVLAATTTNNNSSNNNNNTPGLYIEIGDVLLFDIVRDVCDGEYRAVPTKYRLPQNDTRDTLSTEPTERDNLDTEEVTPAVRLIQLSMAGRSEGTISAIKDTYGFIQYAERPIDVHFKLANILPDHIQNDVRFYMSNGGTTTDSNTFQLEGGTQVQFDLSVHGNSNKNTAAPTSGHRQQIDSENMKGQRILFLPPQTFSTSLLIADNVRGTIAQQDMVQPYCGTIKVDLGDTNGGTNTLRKRHPLIVKMLETYMEQSSVSSSIANDVTVPPIQYHDIQSTKEVNAILKLAEIIGKGQLTHSFIPHHKKNESNSPGRLVIQKKDNQDIAVHNIDTLPVEDCDMVTDNSASQQRKEEGVATVKTVRYDKKSYSNEFRNDMPASVGDVVDCRVVQCRRTGAWRVENIKIVERSSIDDNEKLVISTNDVCGTIKEVMKEFGFITISDEKCNSKKNEAIVFLIYDSGSSGDETPLFRKGDAVRFDISSNVKGKRLAVNLTHRHKKSIKGNNQSNDKNICLGLILLEPSHTTLKNTPIRKASSTASNEKTSRWDTTGDDNRNDVMTTDLGRIVLTSDPGNMFGTSTSRPTMKTDDVDATPDDSIPAPSETEENYNLSHDVPAATTTTANATISTGLFRRPHLLYKASSLASMYQPGATMAAGAKSFTPRRGDLVSFVRMMMIHGTTSVHHHGDSVVIREVRLMTRSAALLVRGKVEWLQGGDTGDERMLRFVCDDDPTTTYDVRATEIVSCDPMLIQDQECVEGILYEGQLYGIARLTDLYVESKYSGANNKERPKLNLTVKKDLGGKIVAQSMMAKGPDGTNGFVPDWTPRVSRFSMALVESSGLLKVDAPEFIPTEQPSIGRSE